SDHKVPLELDEARNAVQLAETAQADQYAQESLQNARTELQNAEGFQHSHAGSKQVITAAREAVQDAEDARVITLRKMRQEQAEAARQAALQRQQQLQSQAQQAQQAADAASQRAQQAETEKAQLRDRLRQQLNTILATRESAKGLIVNMSDVLFDTGKYTLK